MYVMGAFVGVDGFQIGGVAHHLKLLGDSIAAMHVTGHARDIQRLAAIVALDQRNHLWRGGPLIH